MSVFVYRRISFTAGSFTMQLNYLQVLGRFIIIILGGFTPPFKEKSPLEKITTPPPPNKKEINFYNLKKIIKEWGFHFPFLTFFVSIQGKVTITLPREIALKAKLLPVPPQNLIGSQGPLRASYIFQNQQGFCLNDLEYFFYRYIEVFTATSDQFAAEKVNFIPTTKKIFIILSAQS